jgi:Fungal specific transcription factor domain.
MLSGLTTRMTQALQINLEYNTDILCQDTDNGLPVTAKESRRRLMWSCYIMDALVGSGVDQLTLMDERDIKIQLPCNERNFIQKVPCLTETLYPGSWLKILPEDLDTKTLLPNMGIMAYFIRHISIRKRVLRYL